MQTTISNRIIRKLNPCYDPSEVVKDENEELPVKEWVAKYRDLVKDKSDIIWLLCSKLYMNSKDMRLFAVWCAREALKLVESPDQRSVEACNVVERYAKGEATKEELEDTARAASNASDYWAALDTSDTSTASAAGNVSATWNALAALAARNASTASAARNALAASAARNTATALAALTGCIAAKAARYDARGVSDAAARAAEAAAKDAQIDQLMTYF